MIQDKGTTGSFLEVLGYGGAVRGRYDGGRGGGGLEGLGEGGWRDR